jgi:RNA 2',3'-cyclic 3'-phosphodiesterase
LSNGLLRAFIAIEVPEGEAKQRILDLQRKITQTGADIKHVEPENIHITLRFLGEISVKIVTELKSVLGRISFQPFKVTLKGVGVFPDYSRINVIWVGIDEGYLGLVDLYSKVTNSLNQIGIPPDARGLSPHMTVARARSGMNRAILAEAVKELDDFECGIIEVKSFHLKQSTLTPKGPIYRSLFEVPATKL